MDLEDELNRLFHDERLDMRVAPDAETHVVAGARRVRRRRVALMSAAGVLSAAVLAGGAFVLARPTPPSNGIAQQPTLPIETTSSPTPTGAPSSSGPTESSTRPEVQAPSAGTSRPAAPTAGTRSTTPPPSATIPSPVGLAILGPSGVGRMRLGMTEEQLLATSQVHSPERSSAGCALYTSKTATGTVHLSADKTVVAFAFTSGVVTPERVTIGSPEEAVRAAYSGMTGNSVRAPGNANATYEFTFIGGKVSKIALVAAQQSECD
ncbi:hypothetical protein KIPE111705_35145 [Kibdelosporangium persicum]|uniref:Uncharacterized protein n=1 Tax=Kibdelosporangium persicum TaxID=2698649 RepID=A0ABX2EYG5_9PSEU|nr:hypothetical protein [Kibdelosporangium persicum]NRN64090.1 hypothetical protein [Kibdelosporangium persicum]